MVDAGVSGGDLGVKGCGVEGAGAGGHQDVLAKHIEGAGAAVAGAVAGMAFPGIMGALRMSRPIQAYLSNQAVGNVLARPAVGAGASLLPFANEGRNSLR